MLATFGFLGGGGSLELEYQAILDRAIVLGYALPTNSVQTLQNTLVKDLVDGGVWAKLDHLKIYAGSNADFSLINWITPANFLSTKVNSPTYGYAYGFKGDAGSAHLQTGFTPSGLLNYKLNDACYFRYKKSAATLGQIQNYMGAYGVSDSTYLGSFNPQNYNTACNDNAGGGIFTAGTNELSLQLLNRTNSASYQLWENGVNIQTINNNSIAIPTSEFLTCKISITGSSDAEISCEGAGAALTSGQITILNNSFNTYINSL
jgi:hypothetical protein